MEMKYFLSENRKQLPMKKLVCGNWKMLNTRDTFNIFKNYDKKSFENIDSFIAPPSIYISLANEKFPEFIKIGAQDISIYESGAYTGDISGAMLAENNVRYVIVGHSERRNNFNETNEIVNLKMKNALKSNLIPVLCIGESLESRNKKEHLKFLEKQIKESLLDISDVHIEVAYEPIWAIGTGKTAESEEIKEVAEMIRKLMDEMKINARILYGGSVTVNTVEKIKNIDFIDGVLVGGASLTLEFLKIAEIFNK